MDEENFVTQEQLDGITSRIDNLEVHNHDGNNSLPVAYSTLAAVKNVAVVAKVTLNFTQIKLLHTTPISLIAAAGAGSIIVVEAIDAKIVFNSVAYTGANNLEFRYTDASGAKVTADMVNTFINSAATAYDHVAGVVTELTPVANAPITISVPTANPGAGNSPITFIIKYRVISF